MLLWAGVLIVVVAVLPLVVLEIVGASSLREHPDCHVTAVGYQAKKGYSLTTTCGTLDVPASRADGLSARTFQAGAVCTFTTRGVAFGGDRRQVVDADCDQH